MHEPSPKFTSCSFSDKAAQWQPPLHLCTKRDEAQRAVVASVGVVIISVLAFLIGRRRRAFLRDSILLPSLSQKEMYNVTSDRVGNDKNHNLHMERAFNDFKAFSHLVFHLPSL